MDEPELSSDEGTPVFSHKKDNYVFEDRITIFVEPSEDTMGGTQMCPAILVPDNAQIPTAVKHIYSRLSANAFELDQGIPDLLLSMVSDDTTLGTDAKQKLKKGLGRIVGHCGLWLVNSGEQNDALAGLCTSTVKSVLTHNDLTEETLIIGVNSSDIGYQIASVSSIRRRIVTMIDTSVNSYFFILNQLNVSPRKKAEFRSHAAIKLANPPPALLIGVPVEQAYSAANQTPSGSGVSPAIILPNSTRHDCRPLPLALFCAENVVSIFELKNYLDCGVPCIVVQDATDLCALLQTSQIFYLSSNFVHEVFVNWLECELMSIIQHEEKAEYTLTELVETVCHCIAIGVNDHGLLTFVPGDSLDKLPEYICETLLRCAVNNEEYRKVIRISTKLNIAHVIRSLKLTNLFTDVGYEDLLVSALSKLTRIETVDALLENNPCLTVSPQLLIKWHDKMSDLDFFNTVIVGQCLGYSSLLTELTEEFVRDLDRLMFTLSGGFRNLFPIDYFSQPASQKNFAKTIHILCIWALCLNQTEIVKCLWAHSPEPMPLALLLCRIAKSLAYQSKEFFFYEASMNELDKYLTSAACHLLDKSYKSAPRPAYQTLCRPLSIFNNLTLSRLAFETNNKDFLAHDCCQRWVLRLFYGNLQINSAYNSFSLPRWIKILISALFIFPIKFWVTIRPSTIDLNGLKTENPKPSSPTVALLESGHPEKRIRTASTYSGYSARSLTFSSKDDRNAYGAGVQHNPETPRSTITMNQLTTVDDNDCFYPAENSKFINNVEADNLNSRKTRRKGRIAGVCEFYNTPIVKYWLSLTFRIFYLLFFAATISLPGCGNNILNYMLLIWTLTGLAENLWVVYLRSQHSNFFQLRWAVFDIIFITVFLTILIIFGLTGQSLAKYVAFPNAYVAKVLWATLLLYQCYATLFIYIPLSDLLGPFMVRIKLMVTRDFVNFLLLVALLVFSSAVAIKAVVYPDSFPTLPVIWERISWAWLSLLSTDLSVIEQSPECRRSSELFSRSRDYCVAIGGHSKPDCPSSSAFSVVFVVEYLIILKLICWPILFALFSKTAKEVDDEADKIWKYQLYGLATDFSLRPFLPPPLTPFFFLGISCCQLSSCISGVFLTPSFTNSDHPDVVAPSRSADNPSVKYAMVYQNPSVPRQRHYKIKHFYCQAAMEYWKEQLYRRNDKVLRKLSLLSKHFSERMHHLMVASNLSGLGQQASKLSWMSSTADKSDIISVNASHRSWDILIPNYAPRQFSIHTAELPHEFQKYVDHVSPNPMAELCKQWRQRLLHDLMTKGASSIQLSTLGLPLNPNGRTGAAGRGNHVKFGPNLMQYYVIFVRTISEGRKVHWILLDKDEQLPHKYRYDYNSADDFLSKVLLAINVPDSSAQTLTAKGHLSAGQVDNGMAHVFTVLLPMPNDTDNAWTEADVWGVNLSTLSDYRIQHDSADFKWTMYSSLTIAQPYKDFITKSIEIFSSNA